MRLRTQNHQIPPSITITNHSEHYSKFHALMFPQKRNNKNKRRKKKCSSPGLVFIFFFTPFLLLLLLIFMRIIKEGYAIFMKVWWSKKNTSYSICNASLYYDFMKNKLCVMFWKLGWTFFSFAKRIPVFYLENLQKKPSFNKEC